LVNVVETVAVNKAAARKTHELGMQIGNGLGEVGTEAIRMMVKSIFRKQRNHVHGDPSFPRRQHRQSGIGIGVGRFQDGSLFDPAAGRRAQIRPGEQAAGFRFEPDHQWPTGAGKLARKNREVIFFAGFDRDAVEARISEVRRADVFLQAERGVVRITRGKRRALCTSTEPLPPSRSANSQPVRSFQPARSSAENSKKRFRTSSA
jgi:hypothetical protein